MSSDQEGSRGTARAQHTTRIRGLWQRHFAVPVKQSVQLKAFWILGLVFGLAMVVITPPLMGFDETTHFKAVEYFAEGAHRPLPTPEGAVRSVEIEKETARVIDIAGAVQQKKQLDKRIYELFLAKEAPPQGYQAVDLSGAAVYSPVAYAPPVAGLLTAKVLRLSLLFKVWLARIACLVAYLVLAYFALRCLPFGKWAFFVIALLPMTLFQAATISTDGFLNGLVFLYLAIIIRLLWNKSATFSYAKPMLWSVGILGILIAFSKPTYVLLSLLLFLIPAKYFAGKAQRLWYVGGALVAGVATAGIWNFFVKEYAVKIGEVYRHGFNVSPPEQLVSAIFSPFYSFMVVVRTILQKGYDYFGQLFGVFDSEFTLIPVMIAILLLVSIFLGATMDGPKISRLSMRTRWFIGVVGLMVVGAIAATFYLTYTPVAHPVIDGIQGRYFLPLLLLTIPLMGFKSLSVTIKRPERFFVPVVGFALLVACAQIPYVQYWLH